MAYKNVQKGPSIKRLWRCGDATAVFLRPGNGGSGNQHQLDGLLTHRLRAPIRGLGWGLITCISNKFLHVAEAAGLGPQFENFALDFGICSLAECTIFKILLLTILEAWCKKFVHGVGCVLHPLNLGPFEGYPTTQA